LEPEKYVPGHNKYLKPASVEATKRLIKNRLAGEAAEKALGMDKSQSRIKIGPNEFYKPDDNSRPNSMLERKNVKYQADTKQLKKGVKASIQESKRFKVLVNEGTKLSKPLTDKFVELGRGVGKISPQDRQKLRNGASLIIRLLTKGKIKF
jgi:hypothetical protein